MLAIPFKNDFIIFRKKSVLPVYQKILDYANWHKNVVSIKIQSVSKLE